MPDHTQEFSNPSRDYQRGNFIHSGFVPLIPSGRAAISIATIALMCCGSAISQNTSKQADRADEFGTNGTLKIQQGGSIKELPSVVSGVFDTHGGKKVFITDAGVVLDAQSVPDKIGSNSSSVRVNVSLKKIDGEATIDKTEADLPKRLAAAVASVPGKETQALTETLESLRKEAPKIISSSSAEEAAPFYDLLEKTQEEILQIFMALNEKQKEERAGKWGAAYRIARRAEKSQKATYGFDDEWSPKTYSTIFEWCNPIGQLQVEGEPHATCFLIGTNLVLTCEHCIFDKDTLADRKLMDLSVTFLKEAATNQPLKYPVASVVVRGRKGLNHAINSLDKLDYAFLELGPSTSTGRTPQQDGLLPVKIKTEPELARDAAVYVVGYPGTRGKLVADNAHIFVPYEISDDALNKYRLELNGEIQELEDRTSNLRQGQAASLGKQLRAQFADSFKLISQTGNWRFVSNFMYPQHPALAIDSDTFGGDSGSPVFLRKTSEVIGLFFRGLQDADQLNKVTWRQHEEAVPLSAIFQHWTQQDQSGPSRYGISFPNSTAALTPQP
jgi:V8-like Glu-specific endopeptidase